MTTMLTIITQYNHNNTSLLHKGERNPSFALSVFLFFIWYGCLFVSLKVVQKVGDAIREETTHVCAFSDWSSDL